MTSTALVPIVMGHNAFFGVDHLSAARGAAKAAAFAAPARILEVVSAGFAHGAAGIGQVSAARRDLPASIVPGEPPENANVIRRLLAAGLYDDAIRETQKAQLEHGTAQRVDFGNLPGRGAQLAAEPE